MAWPAIVPLFVVALVCSSIGWVNALARHRPGGVTPWWIAAGLAAAGGALVIIGADLHGVAAAAVALVAVAASATVLVVAAARVASPD